MESVSLAERLAEELSTEFECVVWRKNFFTMRNHFYTDLIQKIITFDYAIMIGGEDDLVTRISTREQKIAPRDNVYLEYGLFSSLLSPERVLLMTHKKCRIASDMDGMSLPKYASDEDAVQLARDWLSHFSAREKNILNRADLELLPTVGIAIGYYHNFIEPFVNRLLDAPDQQPFHLTVLIPDFVDDHIANYREDMADRLQLREEVVQKFRIHVGPEQDGVMQLYDLPTNILTLFKTVDYIFDVQNGNNDDTIRAKLRALENFRDHLRILLQSNRRISRRVSLETFEYMP